MKEQSVVHIKIDYDESVRSKKGILSSEADFLRIIKRIKRYEILRGEELNNRLRIQNKLRDLKTNLNKINDVFPKVKLPDLLKKKEEPKKKEEQEEKEISVQVKEQNEENDLESQLREIQEKLKKLG